MACVPTPHRGSSTWSPPSSSRPLLIPMATFSPSCLAFSVAHHPPIVSSRNFLPCFSVDDQSRRESLGSVWGLEICFGLVNWNDRLVFCRAQRLLFVLQSNLYGNALLILLFCALETSTSPRKSQVMLSRWYETCNSPEWPPQFSLSPGATTPVSCFSTSTSHSLLSRRLQDGQMQVHYTQASRLRRDRQG